MAIVKAQARAVNVDAVRFQIKVAADDTKSIEFDIAGVPAEFMSVLKAKPATEPSLKGTEQKYALLDHVRWGVHNDKKYVMFDLSHKTAAVTLIADAKSCGITVVTMHAEQITVPEEYIGAKPAEQAEATPAQAKPATSNVDLASVLAAITKSK